MQKQLILTYDYELFLGSQSGNVEDCLIRPTDMLISIMEESGFKSIFFIDTVYLMRLREMAKSVNACGVDFKKIVKQIHSLIKKGHYVYPHIHPHWLDAKYLADSNEWQLVNIFKYRFSNISKEEQREVFAGSYTILKEIIHEIDPAYEIDCHRAGGWSVQPFTNFQPLYEEFNFKYDFSVLNRFFMFTAAQFFDFSDIPDKNIYRFTNDVTFEVPDGKFIEFVNSTLHVKPFIILADRLLRSAIYKVGYDFSYGSGSGQSAYRINSARPSSQNGFDMSNLENQYIAVEQMSFIKMAMYLEYIKKNDYMHFVSHPKMVTEHNLLTFSRFLKNVKKLYAPETDFKKMIKADL